MQGETSAELQTSVFLGLRFDLKLAILSMFPLALVVLITNQSFFTKKLYKSIARLYIMLVYLGLTLFYLTDFGYFSYLNTRLDAVSLRFLTNLKISSQVLVESYPVYSGSLGLLIFVILVGYLSNLLYQKLQKSKPIFLSKKRKTVYFLTTFLVLSFGIYGSITHYPLRWSEAFFSKNNQINQFTLNPVLYFFDSFAFRNDGVDLEKTKNYFPMMADYLGVDSDTLDFSRKVTFDTPYETKPNIVIVMLESLGVVPMSYYGNPIHSTPYLDSLIQNSVSFDNFYVHKPGTAGSVFASITGLADIDDVKTASRNPRVIDQRIIFDQFNGYEKLYFLGGSANWANIRGVFQSNITGLKIYEEGSYEVEDRADVWGIDDYDLFKESDKVLAELNASNTPFAAYIQTATNHMPFTVPDQRDTYTPLPEEAITKEQLVASGFKSVAQLNALRYLDFNVKTFMERAKKSGYYDNTIFVFFGDHNTSMNATQHYAKEFDLAIQVHHVPFFIHAPKYITPKAIKKTAKLVDVMPTLAHIAKIPHTNYTLGSNALDSLQKTHFGFVHLKIKGEPAVGLVQNGYYYAKSKSGQHKGLYSLNAEEDTKDISAQFPMIAQQMDSLLTAYYHSTKYLYYNNKKLVK